MALLLCPGNRPHLQGQQLPAWKCCHTRNPTHEYRPKSSNNIGFEKYSLDIRDTDVSSLLSTNKGHRLEGKLGEFFQLSSSRKEENEESFEGSFIRTRILTQQRDMKEFLLRSKHREDILRLLRINDGKGYMVVEIRSAVSGKRSQKVELSRENRLAAQLPVHKMTGTALPSGGSSPGAMIQNESGRQRQVKSSMEGEQIFAIQYRTLELRKLSVRPESSVEYGAVTKVKIGAGMFGNEDDRKMVFKDSDEDSDEEEPVEEDGNDNDSEPACHIMHMGEKLAHPETQKGWCC
jgi:hypothetical protein